MTRDEIRNASRAELLDAYRQQLIDELEAYDTNELRDYCFDLMVSGSKSLDDYTDDELRADLFPDDDEEGRAYEDIE